MPNRLLRLPRHLFIFLLILLTTAVLGGNLRLYVPVNAQAVTTPTIAPTDTPPVEYSSDLPEDLHSADTSGVIALAGVLVVIVLVGAVIGWSTSSHRNRRNKK